MHWTYNNHLTFGFNKTAQGVIDKDVFFSKVSSSTKKTTYSPFKEAEIASSIIYKIAKKLNQEIFLLLSGGVDSSAMLKAFLSAGVPFHPIIMRFNDNLNFFDIRTILSFLNRNHINYEIFDLNVLDFFESGKYLEYGKRYQCQSPQLAVHLYLADHIKSCPVFSWQSPAFFYLSNPEKTEIHYSKGLPSQLESVYMRYFVKNKRFGVPFFFLYTPELFKAFLKLPVLKTRIPSVYNKQEVAYTYQIKCETYQQAGFDVKPREDKFTGFEEVRRHYDLLDGESYGIAFNKRYRVPLEKLNPFAKFFHSFIPLDMLDFLEIKQPEQVRV